MDPLFFRNKNELRKWFDKNHNLLTEQWIGYYKVNSGKESVTWSESVDEALCFGWIDGIRKSIDDKSYKIRFTPRKPSSSWSAVNISKIEKLTQLGLMKPEGISAFNKRKDNKSKLYSYEQKSIKLDKKYIDIFKSNKKAWQFFDEKLAVSYQKISIRWVMSAKREETRLGRLRKLINSSSVEEKIPELQKYKK
ncbi:MAG: YdeI/OmpD-associated family protein [Bacteroidetes bacterium]|nr:YdeI/OmpD-associated family protein [Bacteroidota bacterium]